MNQIDLHIHTTASGHAFGTLSEYVESAAKNGMKAIAITDHGPNMKGASGAAYFSTLCFMVPSMIEDIRIFKGIEANILDTDGTLDVSFDAKPNLDLVLAYLHPFTAYRDAGAKTNTRAIISAIERNPCIDIISHPLTPWYATDIKEIALAGCEQGIALELNENVFRSYRIDEAKIEVLIGTVLANKGRFVISSDTHHVSALGTDSESVRIVEKYGIPHTSILTYSLQATMDFVTSRKELKKK
jgi:putative hydrolase